MGLHRKAHDVDLVRARRYWHRCANETNVADHADIAPSFHSALGPIVIIMYSCLANTLVVSVVVAILSHTCAMAHALRL